MDKLPKWDKIKNEVGPWNDFSIVRGKDQLKKYGIILFL